MAPATGILIHIFSKLLIHMHETGEGLFILYRCDNLNVQRDEGLMALQMVRFKFPITANLLQKERD